MLCVPCRHLWHCAECLWGMLIHTKLSATSGGKLASRLRLEQYFISLCMRTKVNQNQLSSPSLEYIDYVNIQTVPLAIPSWYSYLRTSYIAQQRRHKGRVYNMDTHVKTQLSFLSVTKLKDIQGAASDFLKCTFFSSLKVATSKILLPLFSPACYPVKILFSSVSLSFCCYFSLSYKVLFLSIV